jgi:ankyrin repeat protein
MAHHDNNEQLRLDTSLCMAFIAAARDGNVLILQSLASQTGLDVNFRGSSDRETAIFAAASQNKTEAVRYLLNAFPALDINAVDRHGETPLSTSVQHNNPELTQLILAHPGVNVRHRLRNGQSVLSLTVTAHATGVTRILLPHLTRDEINAAMEAPTLDINQYTLVPMRRMTRMTALSTAAFLGWADLVAALLESDLVDVNEDGGADTTPLGAAVQNCHTLCVRFLLADARTDVNVLVCKRVPLVACAIRNGDIPTMRLLMAHDALDINKCGVQPDEESALFVAAAVDDPEMLQLLLKHPKIDVNARTLERNATALMFAAGHERATNVRVLLSHQHIDVNLTDAMGKTALMTAIACNCPDAAWLIASHPDTEVNRRSPDEDRNALWTAIQRTDWLSTWVLLNHREIDVNVLSADRASVPLMVLAIQGQTELVDMLVKHPRIKINYQTYQGHTPMHWAVMYSRVRKANVDCVRAILSHPDVDLSLRAVTGFTSLMYAAIEPFGFTEALLQSGKVRRSVLFAQNPEGQTALAIAQSRGNRRVVQLLTDFEAEVPDDLPHVPLLNRVANMVGSLLQRAIGNEGLLASVVGHFIGTGTAADRPDEADVDGDHHDGNGSADRVD